MSRHSTQLADTRHLLITSFEDDGSSATATTWVVPDGPALGVWARTDSAVVRHVRSHPGVLVEPCDQHGRPLGGRRTARAVLCDPDTTACYRTSLLNKYGLTGMLALVRSRLRLGLAGTVGIRITLTDPDAALPFGAAWTPPPWYSLN
ncbi:PPOX class F420-dependent oxidoreductase [Kitasatospora sp. NPDC002040]|uniref:PPOX class F420-dependent oxidoreductase n=1 Tax=Kitasatospora sp. NPDC002040 TaxID=3154661 RepID=UPI00332B52E6